jgi:CheY-like chemotaxis protein
MQNDQRPRVFVVDDEKIIATTLQMILSRNGYDATSFTNPREALNAARMRCPHLLISDVAMPGMSGVELVVELRRLCRDVKVIFLSAHTRTGELLEAAGQARDGFRIVTKPIHPSELLAIVWQTQPNGSPASTHGSA